MLALHKPGVDSFSSHVSSILPEVLEAIGGQLGVTDRVLDVLVPEPSLQRPRVVAGVGQAPLTESD